MSVHAHPTHPGWWQVKHYPEGKKGGVKVFVVRGGTHDEALLFENDLRRESKGVTCNPSSLPTISEAIPFFIQHYRLEHLPSGVVVMARYMARWSKIVGRVKFASISIATIEEYKHKRIADGIKPTSINKELSAFSGLLKWAIDKGYCQEVKIKRFPAKMTKSPLPDVPTREEVLALINCMIWPKCGLFACLYFAGLRASEAENLTVDKVHLDHGLMIVRGKGNKERPVPIVDELRPYLEKRIAEGSGGLMFQTRSGGKITDLKKIIKLAKERAGLTRHFYPHLLRHAFGTHATHAGVNLRSLQYAMGHTTSQTTEIYTTLSSAAIIKEISGKFGKI
jgi:site-specific recombinase XerD